jgi:hypothetical protein
MPPCPCPDQAPFNTLAAKLYAKRKTMAMGRDARGLARGIVRADWLLCFSRKKMNHMEE